MVKYLWIIVFLIGLGNASTITVGPSGYDYPSIQKAVYEASSGDKIEVHGGSYNEELYIDKKLNLLGVDQPRISGESLYISADGVTLEGFSIAAEIDLASNSNIVNNNYITSGFVKSNYKTSTSEELKTDGIAIRRFSNNTITNNVISGCYDGIFLYESNLNKISGNSINGNTRGMKLISSASNIITGNIANNNDGPIEKTENGYTTPGYYGIQLESSSNNIIKNNQFCNNGDAGMLLTSSSGNTITDNTVSNNYRDGINSAGSSSNIIKGNIIQKNKQTGILSTSSNNFVSENTVSGNKYDTYQNEFLRGANT